MKLKRLIYRIWRRLISTSYWYRRVSRGNHKVRSRKTMGECDHVLLHLFNTHRCEFWYLLFHSCCCRCCCRYQWTPLATQAMLSRNYPTRSSRWRWHAKWGQRSLYPMIQRSIHYHWFGTDEMTATFRYRRNQTVGTTVARDVSFPSLNVDDFCCCVESSGFFL